MAKIPDSYENILANNINKDLFLNKIFCFYFDCGLLMQTHLYLVGGNNV